MEKFMAIPRKVREAEERANALHKQLYESKNVNEPNPAPDPTPDPAPAPTPSPDPIPDPALDGNGGNPPNSEPPAPPQDDKWEQRYKVIEGKYRAEVPRMAAENKELRSQMAELAAQVESLKSQAESLKAPLITDADKEKYGEDLLDVIKRATQQATASKDAEIADLKRRMDTVTTTASKVTESSYYSDLNRAAPNWVQLNSDERFLSWLDEYDPLTGRTRQELLEIAEQERDAERTARFFTLFEELHGENKTPPPPTPNKSAHQAPDSRKNNPAPAAKRYFTRAEIRDFYAACRAGRVSPKDMVAMEAEIHAASLEGRVR